LKLEYTCHNIGALNSAHIFFGSGFINGTSTATNPSQSDQCPFIPPSHDLPSSRPPNDNQGEFIDDEGY
jgi:hypothetical protein